MFKVGDQVGEFSAQSSTGASVLMSSLRGKAFVVFFYPKSFTPGCTIETKAFAKLYPQFQTLGVEVLGVSSDHIERQCDFASQMGAEFPILDDTQGDVAWAFGLKKNLLGMYKRMTFVVDERGVIEQVFKVGFGVGMHPDRVLDYMARRQV